MNALRLNKGFELNLFTSRTGLEESVILSKLQSLQERGLLQFDGQRIQPTDTGSRFLDTVIADFFPDH